MLRIQKARNVQRKGIIMIDKEKQIKEQKELVQAKEIKEKKEIKEEKEIDQHLIYIQMIHYQTVKGMMILPIQ